MKTLIYTAVILFSTLAFAQKSEGVTLTIVFENLVNDEGKVSAGLYDETTFMVAEPLNGAEGKPENRKLTLTLKNVKPGSYGIVTLHDQNENGRMDFETSGMPKEPYGMSGNAMVMGPPTFEDAKFEVGEEDLTLNIRM